MGRGWAIGLSLACACTTTSAKDRAAKTSDEEREVRRRRIGTLAAISEYEVRNAVLDETKTEGPSRVVWLHPPNASIIKTVEGDIYRCDAAL